MNGISYKANNTLSNKLGFNGGNGLENREFSDDSGLELYDAHFRMYDPQLGRFFQIDKLAELSIDFTLYGFVHNNPINRNDPLGLSDELPEVVVYSNRTPEQKTSVMLNNSNYMGVANWVDHQIERGYKPEQIWQWARHNDWLDKSTLWNIADATKSGTISYRRKSDLEKKQDAKYAKFIATTILVATGTGLLEMLLEGGEVAILAEEGGEEANAISKSVGADVNLSETCLQTGGNTLNKYTLEALKLTKEQGKIAIESLKKFEGLRNDFHGKIMGNGDVINSSTLEWVGNLFDYLP
jgi:RHS repeat-associated protein